MAFHISMNCYPWDLVDEGIDTVLDRLKGEAGVTGISVPFSCGPVEQLRPHAGVSPRTFRSRGGVQFQPDASHYAGTRIRPVVDDWLRKSNPLAAIAEASAKRGLTFRGSLQCCNCPITVERYESCAVKDVFGDINPSWLCPVNPDVREYLRSLVREIDSTYHPETLELDSLWFPNEAPGWPPFGFQAKLPSQISLFDDPEESMAKIGGIKERFDNFGEWLHSLCFCESCRQAANRDSVDHFAAARSATVTIERIFATGESPEKSFKDILDESPVLNAFVKWRWDQIKSLLNVLQKSCGCRLVMHLCEYAMNFGVDYPGASSHVSTIVRTGLMLDERILQTLVRLALRTTDDISGVELDLDICKTFCPDSATLVKAVAQAASLGVRRINVSNYGEMPINRLAWIKQAARYVNRELS